MMLRAKNCCALIVFVAFLLIDAEVYSYQHVRPEGISVVNGSSTEIECTGQSTRNGTTLCSCSYLEDGVTPDIDLSNSNWASELVTIKKLNANSEIDYPHVLLTFAFETNVTLNKIQIDLLYCPTWKIGTDDITVYMNKQADLNLKNSRLHEFSRNYETLEESCNSLLTVTLDSLPFDSSGQYNILFIIFKLDPSLVEWVHIGEVRLKGGGIAENQCPATSPPSTPISPHPTTPYSPVSCLNSSEESCTDPTSTASTPAFTSTAASIDREMRGGTGSESGGPSAVVIGFSITTVLLVVGIVILLVFIGASFFIKSRRKQSEISNADLGVWQNGTASHNSGENTDIKNSDYQKVENDDNTAPTTFTESELPNYNDLQAPTYNPSFTNPNATLSDGVYDKVAKDEFGVLSDGEDYDDVKVPSVAGGAHAQGPETEYQNTPHATHLYSHVKKDNPRVPQKSTDLVQYMATRAVGGRNASVSSRSQLAYNPVYEVSGEAMCAETRRFLDSTNGEEMYDRPGAHRAVPVDDVDRGVANESETTPEPSAPVMVNEPIHPSHFTIGYQGEESEDPHIYAPVYAVPSAIPDIAKPVIITNQNIVEKKELGMGQFGRVVLAATNGLSLKDMKMGDTDDKNISILVAVKRLAAKPSSEDRQVFEKEVKLMSSLKHQNVVSLLGVCYQDPAFIMMEYMEEGDLNHFLKCYTEIVSTTTTSNRIQITTSTLVYMASQIASAMQYLASHNYIHRDLASRNCLVGGNYVVKISDFGMSRSLYQSHYYRIQGNAILPIRWMATESFFGIFSEKTDVWSFGVTMWELFTLANKDPYPQFTDTELVEDAIRGVNRQLLDRPPSCPSSLYKIMLQCWVIDPKGRATFKAVQEMLQSYWYTPESAV